MGSPRSISYMWLLEARLAHEKNSKCVCHMSKLILEEILEEVTVLDTHIIHCTNYIYIPAILKSRQHLEGLASRLQYWASLNIYEKENTVSLKLFFKASGID